MLETTASFLATGLDPNKSIIFNQSSVSGHAELAWVLNCISRIGWLNRMTQFKDKAGSDKEKASVGLYIYPNLMAADILLYKATHVPVGADQKQHLELSRDIAQKFNKDFNCKDFFPLPEPLISKNISRTPAACLNRNCSSTASSCILPRHFIFTVIRTASSLIRFSIFVS